MNSRNENDPPMPPTESDHATQAEGPEQSGTPDEGARPGTTDVQAYIGRQLRAVYDDVVKQPIPDRFLLLMKQLEEQGSQD